MRDQLDLRAGPMAPDDSASRGAVGGTDRGRLQAVQVADDPGTGTADAPGGAGATGGSVASTADGADRTPTSAAPAGEPTAGTGPGTNPSTAPTGARSEPGARPTDQPAPSPEATPGHDGPLPLPTLPVTPSAAVTFPDP